jgi:hypothetical protein
VGTSSFGIQSWKGEFPLFTRHCFYIWLIRTSEGSLSRVVQSWPFSSCHKFTRGTYSFMLPFFLYYYYYWIKCRYYYIPHVPRWFISGRSSLLNSLWPGDVVDHLGLGARIGMQPPIMILQ